MPKLQSCILPHILPSAVDLHADSIIGFGTEGVSVVAAASASMSLVPRVTAPQCQPWPSTDGPLQWALACTQFMGGISVPDLMRDARVATQVAATHRLSWLAKHTASISESESSGLELRRVGLACCQQWAVACTVVV